MEEIHSNFFRESRSFYNLKSLSERLKITEEEGKKVISRLRSANIIKSTTKQSFDMEKLQDTEEIITDERIFSNYENGFTFNFVGIAYTENCILKCYPKYIDDEMLKKTLKQVQGDKSVQQDKFNSHFKKVLRTIQKYNDEKQVSVPIFNGMEKAKNFNRLAVELYLLRDYYTNGIYTNQKTIIETNGEGFIDWDKTINETFAIIKNNNPYYIDLQTVEIQDNVQDFFRQLHECILTKCSEELDQLGLLDLFDISPVKLNPMNVSDFGTVDYIKYRIEQEIRNQFVTKKQNLLKTLYVFISETESSTIQDCFSFFGTNAFNMVWEKACSAIFDDVKDKKIDELKRNKIIEFENYIPNEKSMKSTLKTFIEKAKWNFSDSIVDAKETLEPDIISIFNNTFFIFDGKYYLISHDKNDIKNQPGIQDVIKQFAYHKAYYDFLQTTKLEKVSNIFLVPMISPCEKNIKFSGLVELDLMQSFAMETLCPISLVELNPNYVFENYLQNKKITKDFSKSEAKNIKTTSIIRNSVSAFNWQKDYMPNLHYTMVGLIRNSKDSPYMEKIKSLKNDFLFFFYRKKGNVVYPIHNLLPCCNKFIGYNPNLNYQVEGELKVEENIPMQILDRNKLIIELEKSGYSGMSKGHADSYYAVRVRNVKIIENRSIVSLKKSIREFEGNDILSDFSPKVINQEYD